MSTSGATRGMSSDGSPMWKSSPSGLAISAWNTSPSLVPVAFAISAPVSQP